jgi:hypothetical protein
MNSKSILGISFIVAALVISGYSLGWVNFGPVDRVIPLAPLAEKPEGSPALGNRESIDSDDESGFNWRSSIGSEYDVNDDIKGGSRKRRRMNSKRQSKKQKNKKSKSNKRRRHSRQISKKKI